MKKLLLAILLIYLAASCESCASSPGGACDCDCGGGQGSFNVNKPVVIDTPSTIAPPCPTPVIPIPEVKPPVVDIPNIDPSHPKVCTLNVPQVVAPPTVEPPKPVLPVIPNPVIPVPQLPPQIPLPTIPIVNPPRPVYSPPSSVGPGCSSLSNIFTFSFQWACREGVAFISCEANVIWNDVIIASIVPVDYEIHLYKVNVTVREGRNSLQIEGAGVSDSYGLTIDNVVLTRLGSAQNIVINGGFDLPNQYGGWNIYNGI